MVNRKPNIMARELMSAKYRQRVTKNKKRLLKQGYRKHKSINQ